MVNNHVISANTILYCRNWKETVCFYRDGLSLKINFSTDWFVEFVVSGNARISIVDEKRASIKASNNHGITISLQVPDIKSAWNNYAGKGLGPTEIKVHPWNAKVFYLYDPEGRRLEVWQADKN